VLVWSALTLAGCTGRETDHVGQADRMGPAPTGVEASPPGAESGATLLADALRALELQPHLQVTEKTRVAMSGHQPVTWTISGRYDRDAAAVDFKLRKRGEVDTPALRIRRIRESTYVSNDGWTGEKRGKWLLVTPALEQQAVGSDPFYDANSAVPTPAFAVLDHLDPQARILRRSPAKESVALRTSVALGDALPVLEPILPAFWSPTLSGAERATRLPVDVIASASGDVTVVVDSMPALSLFLSAGSGESSAPAPAAQTSVTAQPITNLAPIEAPQPGAMVTPADFESAAG